jgi:hypothetical protein
MFHSVAAADVGWLWDELTCPVAVFERVTKSMRARGYGPATLDDLLEMQTTDNGRRDRHVVLTFDDGYLDNWVHVYPILKRAGLRGIAYVNPEFVDPGTIPRPNLEDVWSGRVAESELQSRGFLNWAEIELLDRSGVLAIGSHSMSHTWYATGPEIVDFHRPGLETPWLAWNARPDRKAFYRLEDQSGFVPWGTPIMSHGRSLGIRRFFPDEAIAPTVVQYVESHGREAFFLRRGWRQELAAVAAAADRGHGRVESDDEMDRRFVYEIGNAFRVLEERLGHPVRHFCWPGGAYCDAAWQVLNRIGCLTSTIKRSDLERWQAADPRYVRRISEFRQYSMLGRSWRNQDSKLLPAACDVELGRPGAHMELRIRKLVGAARDLRRHD